MVFVEKQHKNIVKTMFFDVLMFVDCFICFYHDQALIPFKIISGFNGVNFTGSLDIVRVSPNHGTAYDIVSANKANSGSLFHAFKLADIISKNRIKK